MHPQEIRHCSLLADLFPMIFCRCCQRLEGPQSVAFRIRWGSEDGLQIHHSCKDIRQVYACMSHDAPASVLSTCQKYIHVPMGNTLFARAFLVFSRLQHCRMFKYSKNERTSMRVSVRPPSVQENAKNVLVRYGLLAQINYYYY